MQSNGALLSKNRVALAPVRKLSSGYRILNLDSLTDFAWDSVYYFTEEVSERHISATIGFSWKGPDVPNSCKRLLFVHNRQVATFVDFNQYANSDEQIDWPIPIHMWVCTELAKTGRTVCPRNKARFAVSRSCSKYGIEYPLVPLACLDTPLRNVLEQGCLPFGH
jgi:hypothetical protein